MTKIDWFSRPLKEQRLHSGYSRITGSIGVVVLLLSIGAADAQSPAPAAPVASVPAKSTPAAAAPAASEPVAPEQVVENGYLIRQSADLGGHVVGISGSGAMYNTLVNIHSGPRVLGETFTMHALPGTKHPWMDSLSGFSSGFGGDPNNFAKLDFSKGKYYEFNGVFRRDRQYFDYDLLGNPSIPSGITIPYGLTAGVPTAASVAWPQANQSPVMFNTVRRMTDTYLTILPLSKVSYRVGYSQNIFQGPSLSPGYSIGKSDLLLQEYQRNSTDEFLAAIDWKPFQLTKITFEEQVDHYKADSYFTIAPSEFNVQEANGTPASLGNWDAVSAPYTITSCNTASMGAGYTSATTYTIFTAPQTPGGLPVINPACDVITSYLRLQPTRIVYPTEIARFQSSSVKNVAMNGDFRYSVSKSKLPNYYENFQGLDTAIRSATFTGNAIAQRRVVSLDYGLTWQATKTIALSDQVDSSNVHQPGYSDITTGVTQNTPVTAGNETINYPGPLLAGAAFTVSGNPTGTALYAYFGQKFITNNATLSWDATSRLTASLTYRYRTHTVVQTTGTGRGANVIGMDENGGILNVAFRPTANWSLNGTVEILYDDNSFTPLGPRQTKHYRFHTLYKPRPWATVSGAFNDLERHNNTNNTGTPLLDGPLGHVDHSRIGSLGLTLAPNVHYGVDVYYAYSDIYTSTNICYLNGASATVPGTASTTSTGAPNICPGVFVRGSTTVLSDWGPTKDFMDAPTQYASVSLNYSPNKKIRTAAGYRISAVSGNQFFADAQQVNGSLQSAYQSPFLNFAWTVHPGLVWRAEYNYYGYGEGGPSGPQFCSTSTSTTAAVVPCTSLAAQTGLTEPSSGLTAPRNTHANILTLAVHYEF